MVVVEKTKKEKIVSHQLGVSMGSLLWLWGAGSGEESRISSQYKQMNRLPKFGPQRCVIP